LQRKIKIISIAILLFTAIGCSQSEPNNTGKSSSYYADLREVCQTKADKNCCLNSVDVMKKTMLNCFRKVNVKRALQEICLNV